MANTIYTTADRVVKRVGSLGVQLHTEFNDQALAEAMETASAEIEWYCHQYTPEALAGSRWVGTKATDLTIYHLFILQANPAPSSVSELYAHSVEQLQQVQQGKAVIPGAAIGRSGYPAVTNYRVELDRFPGVRVERPRTSGPQPEGYPRRTDSSADQAVR